ncbi:hypothetical protein QMK17_20700 [Rhodococcus sp. G-MC3]|uniref:hypothetical protein n=1 Tax=Rhodococcus sp. G-MC3 TaxID=3046209 RepID=UPI0024BAA6EF|nr:hypothetical protein [Rhodococcus sp. G-MC3]MDJ0395745.1 hypothetical protein [Rhodococcus sp. G-MC3]
MTLADSRPVVAASSAVFDTASASTDAASLSVSQLEMMRSFFCYEFEVAQLDRESIPVPTSEAVAEWIEALAMSGLFVTSELRTMTDAWLSEPEALISLLVGDIDEVAARREVTGAVAEIDVKSSFLRAS